MYALARLRRQERWALAALGWAVAAVVLLPLARPVDAAWLRWLQEHCDRHVRAIAHRMDDGVRVALIAAAVALAWKGQARGVVVGLATLASGAFVGELLKTAIERPRPSAPLDVLVGNSLPSGHIMNTAIAAMLVGVLALRTDWSRGVKGFVILVATVAVMAQAAGRMMHGSHWPSDVAPSVLLGVAWVLGVGRWAKTRRAVRVALVAVCLGAYALFYTQPGARLFLAAPARTQLLHSRTPSPTRSAF